MTEILEQLTSSENTPGLNSGYSTDLLGITHPAHHTWRKWKSLDGRREIGDNTDHLFSTNERYTGDIVSFIGGLTEKLSRIREKHEYNARQYAGIEYGTKEYSHYEYLVGNQEQGLNAIKFLGAMVAKNYLQVGMDSVNPKLSVERQKIVFELGGTLQLGDWGSTRLLDAMGRKITNDAKRDDKVDVHLRGEDGASLSIRYRIERTADNLHAIIRRRRELSDIDVLTNGRELGPRIIRGALFKESSAVIPLLNIDPESRIIISTDCIENPDANRLTSSGSNNTDAAVRGGLIFQQAIRDTNAGLAVTTAVPLGAQYVVSFRDLVAK